MNGQDSENWARFLYEVFKGTDYENITNNPEIFDTPSIDGPVLIEEETLLPQALYRIKNPPGDSEHSEHHVGTWAMTMLKHIFTGLSAITPGQRNDQSGRYPNIVVEKDGGAGILEPVLFCVLKKKGGDSLTTALSQLGAAIAEAMDQQGSNTPQNHSTFAYVQRGTEVGIFEYHNVGTILDEQRVPHHNGFVPITQPYLLTNKDGEKTVVKGMPTPANLKDLKLVLDSKDWDVPCIFDIEKKDNRECVYFLLWYINSYVPRKYLFGKLQYLNEVSILLIH